MKPGHCTACGLPCWRGLTRPDTQQWLHLWPDPTSVYAVLATPDGLAVGLAYHAPCAPALGDPGVMSATVHGHSLGPSTVVRLDRAPERYQYWFSPPFGRWLAVWLRELATDLRAPYAEFEPLLAEWARDGASSVVREVTVDG